MAAKATYYDVQALYRKKRAGSYQYEWKVMRTFSNKLEAKNYAKRESSISYKDGRTGRYMITKCTNEVMYQDGKIVK